jgi:hypothetical protein
MTLLPRSAISPVAVPSAGTSVPSGAITRTVQAIMLPTPWRAFSRAVARSSSPFHSGRQSQIMAGPNVSVSPYRWVTSKPSSAIRRRIAGVGGAPPVATFTGCSSGAAPGA